jgi:hypothetical protein
VCCGAPYTSTLERIERVAARQPPNKRGKVK